MTYLFAKTSMILSTCAAILLLMAPIAAQSATANPCKLLPKSDLVRLLGPGEGSIGEPSVDPKHPGNAVCMFSQGNVGFLLTVGTVPDAARKIEEALKSPQAHAQRDSVSGHLAEYEHTKEAILFATSKGNHLVRVVGEISRDMARKLLVVALAHL